MLEGAGKCEFFDFHLVNEITSIMKDSGADYFTIDYIARHSEDLTKDDILLCFQRNKDKFRKSVLPHSSGEDLYMIERRFGLLIDMWKAYRYLNYIKYFAYAE